MATQKYAGIGWGNADVEQQQIDRQRQLATALQQKSMEPGPQGQNVSGHYVAPAWTQQLAHALSGWAGNKQNERADQRQADLAGQRQELTQRDMSAFAQALKGQDAIPEAAGNNPSAYAPAQAAQPPDLQKAMGIALQSRNPGLQAAGGQLFSQMLPKAAEWTVSERFNEATGRPEKVLIDKNNPTKVMPFGGQSAVKGTAINGQLVDPATGQAIGQAVPKQADLASDLLIPDGKGGMVPNSQLVGLKKDIAKSGAASTNVSVNTATKPFLNEIGKGVGEAVNSAFTGAQSAQGTLNNVDQIRKGLGNAILGPGANARIKLGQIGEVLGVNGKDSTEQLQNTRNVLQGLARQELSAAGQMKGQGQITESERGILRRAEAGDITELTKPEVETLLGALEKTSRYRIQSHNRNLERLRQDPNAAGVVDFMRVDEPSATAAPARATGGFKIIGVQ